MKEYIMADYDGGQKIGDLTVVGELVRCKDCRHFMNADENYMDEYGNHQTNCPYMAEASEEDFCSKAERKEDA